MKVWQLPAYNNDVSAAIASLQQVDVPVPASVGAGNLLVKVKYASVNPIDWKLFTGGLP